jgi:hypothetical protein
MRRSLFLLSLAMLACTAAVSARAHAQAMSGHAAHAPMDRATPGAALTPELASAKAALSKYTDVTAALRDGYLSTVGCIDFSRGAKDGNITYPPGAMGVHFLNMGNVGPKLDPAKPQILIYAPVNGKLELAAAEWFMPVQVAGGKAPVIFGQTLAGPMEGHQPIMPKNLRHYDLHAWLWKSNPKGVFTSTNSALTCPAGAPYTYDLSDAQHHM